VGTRRFTFGVKTTDLCFGHLVGLRHTPMRTLVLNPLVHEKCLSQRQATEVSGKRKATIPWHWSGG
jgi:hypothetical protein